MHYSIKIFTIDDCFEYMGSQEYVDIITEQLLNDFPYVYLKCGNESSYIYKDAITSITFTEEE